jgi:hypothetical protein
VKKLSRLVRPLGVVVTAGQVVLTARQHWRGIPAERRERLGTLVRESKGNPKRLSHDERAEMRELVRGLQLPRLLRRTARVVALGRRLGRGEP